MGDDTVGRAWYELGARDERLDADLRDAEGKIKASGKAGADHYEKSYTGASQKVSAGFGSVRNSLAAIGIGIGLTTVISFFGGAIGAASDLNEEVDKAGIVFGASADKVENFADRADKAFGLSKQQALAAAGGYGNMFRTIGFADAAAADMSITMVQLASDMASFNNQDPSDMLIRLRAGLSGEAEPLRQFGVLLSEARVKAEAYSAGIAAVGSELTETQKVQARYSLILKDTALQQGNFALTADSLANRQREAAATWANAMAKIGQALLPLAKDLTQFATDVMPAVGEAITGVLEAAGPLLAMFFTLSKILLEHASVVVPLLVGALAIKLVGAFRAAQVAGVGSATAIKVAWGAALLGIPLLFEHVREEQQKAAADMKDPRLALPWDWLIGSPFREVVEDTSAAMDAAGARWAGNTRSFVTEAAAALREGGSEVADGAAMGITVPISDAALRAREAAVVEAGRIPGEIAAAILEGRDEVLAAASGLGEAATDPLLQKARLTEIREQMRDVAQVTAEELRAATPATVAADKLKYALLEIQLAGYLLRADPMSKEAAGLLAKYANSADAATKAAYEALMGAVEDRAYIMANDIEGEAERAGIAPEEALDRHRAAAAGAAAILAAGIRNRMRMEFDGTVQEADDFGLGVAHGFADGLRAGGELYVRPASKALAGIPSGFLESHSPPREGPLREISKWGFSLGKLFGDDMGRGYNASSFLNALGGPQMALTGAGAAGALPASVVNNGGSTVENHYHLTVQGLVRAETPEDIGLQLRRMVSLAQR